MSNAFQRYDAGTSVIPISSLHSLLCSMMRPLGFRAQDGTLVYGASLSPDCLALTDVPSGTPDSRGCVDDRCCWAGEWERASELLIRAELNVLVRVQRNAAEARKMSLWQRFLPSSAPHEEKLSYEDVIKTILFWRKPNMVPLLVKKSRR